MLLAVAFLTAWFFPFAMGPDTPATLRFILVAEVGYLVLRLMIAAPMEQEASRLEAALWVLFIAGGVAAFLVQDGGVVGAVVFFLHLAADLPRLQDQMQSGRRQRVGWALVPVCGFGLGAVLLVAGVLPELGWTRWAIPPEFWLDADSPDSFSHAIPAIGSVYFFMVATAALGRPLSEIQDSRAAL